MKSSNVANVFQNVARDPLKQDYRANVNRLLVEPSLNTMEVGGSILTDFFFKNFFFKNRIYTYSCVAKLNEIKEKPPARIELATPSLRDWCTTTVLRRHAPR